MLLFIHFFSNNTKCCDTCTSKEILRTKKLLHGNIEISGTLGTFGTRETLASHTHGKIANCRTTRAIG